MRKKISSQNTKIYTKEDFDMVIMDLEIHNFYAFRNFHINMSYPKKILNSSIEHEHLKDHSNFRYKKVNILMGANATGKTSIGKMLMDLFNFIAKQNDIKLAESVGNTSETATVSMKFVVQGRTLYCINLKIDPKPSKTEDPVLSVCTRSEEILEKDSYESCNKRLESQKLIYQSNYADELKKITGMGWLFSYPEDFMSGVVYCSKNKKYPQILDHTLRALDPSIIAVEKIDAVENTYVIRTKNKDLVIQDGEVIKNNILSSGTKEGIDIAEMLTAIISGENGFYYCDEKFSYIHSDMEKAFLSVMIGSLKENDQLFFTTHNSDILEMPLPKHSFTFLKKDIYDKEMPIKCVSASEYLKRSTDSVRNAVENDLFSAAPSVELVYEIEDL